jgi:hypothetical protein
MGGVLMALPPKPLLQWQQEVYADLERIRQTPRARAYAERLKCRSEEVKQQARELAHPTPPPAPEPIVDLDFL